MPLNSVAFKMLRIILFDSKIQNTIINLSVFLPIHILSSGGNFMKNKFIKSLMNSLNSRKKERGLSGDLSMKKESNGIGENKNSKKISKNNKIISSILAVIMCCQPLVMGVVDGGDMVQTIGKKIMRDGVAEPMNSDNADDDDDDDIENNIENGDGDHNSIPKENQNRTGGLLVKFGSIFGFGSVFGILSTLLVNNLLVRKRKRNRIEKGSITINEKEYLTCNIGKLVVKGDDYIHNLTLENLYGETMHFFADKITTVRDENANFLFFNKDEIKEDVLNKIWGKAEEMGIYSILVCKMIIKGKFDTEDFLLKSKFFNEFSIFYFCLMKENFDFRLVNVKLRVFIESRNEHFDVLVPEEVIKCLKDSGAEKLIKIGELPIENT
ncbi:MAG: hypothetical protein CfP315_0651 [Candidatus Improbicoccus pseudotrichonymphae]|uniref:Uncharacterized protein n=1 Tax=Candidatus Improbicoccus pseudotrichonymphae TaxID=3033792 RepID=A0AA48HVB1_9FIRM|nr:MAG: hypothetical protein CfP315_0651 [Candidatus Improbicoccus pseudotrichonymphae]